MSSTDDRPRLRPLEGVPVEHDGESYLELRDPSGLSESVARLPPVAVAVVQLCDGTLTRDEVCAEFQQRYHQRLPREALDIVLGQLDQALLLDSAHFREHSVRVYAEFARAEARPATLAGRSYPAEAAELAALLDGFFDPPHGPGRADRGTGPRPRAIVSPHIDFQRGGPAYAWAYRPLLESADDPPELVVIFGTDHQGADHPFTLTRKHYDTPLGRLATDVELVDRLAREAGGERLFLDEYHHRGEHSVEFQAVWLRHVYGDRADGIRALPVLCGSLHEFVENGADPEQAEPVGGFLRALAAAVADRKVLWIAGADLAHVGPNFGDAEPLSDEDRGSLERRDQKTLDHVCRGDAAGWFTEIRHERDRRRVCGLPPVFALLHAGKPGAGRLEAYAQCPAPAESIVSIASVVFR